MGTFVPQLPVRFLVGVPETHVQVTMPRLKVLMQSPMLSVASVTTVT